MSGIGDSGADSFGTDDAFNIIDDLQDRSEKGTNIDGLELSLEGKGLDYNPVLFGFNPEELMSPEQQQALNNRATKEILISTADRLDAHGSSINCSKLKSVSAQVKAFAESNFANESCPESIHDKLANLKSNLKGHLPCLVHETYHQLPRVAGVKEECASDFRSKGDVDFHQLNDRGIVVKATAETREGDVLSHGAKVVYQDPIIAGGKREPQYFEESEKKTCDELIEKLSKTPPPSSLTKSERALVEKFHKLSIGDQGWYNDDFDGDKFMQVMTSPHINKILLDEKAKNLLKAQAALDSLMGGSSSVMDQGLKNFTGKSLSIDNITKFRFDLWSAKARDSEDPGKGHLAKFLEELPPAKQHALGMILHLENELKSFEKLLFTYTENSKDSAYQFPSPSVQGGYSSLAEIIDCLKTDESSLPPKARESKAQAELKQLRKEMDKELDSLPASRKEALKLVSSAQATIDEKKESVIVDAIMMQSKLLRIQELARTVVECKHASEGKEGKKVDLSILSGKELKELFGSSSYGKFYSEGCKIAEKFNGLKGAEHTDFKGKIESRLTARLMTDYIMKYFVGDFNIIKGPLENTLADVFDGLQKELASPDLRTAMTNSTLAGVAGSAIDSRNRKKIGRDQILDKLSHNLMQRLLPDGVVAELKEANKAHKKERGQPLTDAILRGHPVLSIGTYKAVGQAVSKAVVSQAETSALDTALTALKNSPMVKRQVAKALTSATGEEVSQKEPIDAFVQSLIKKIVGSSVDKFTNPARLFELLDPDSGSGAESQEGGKEVASAQALTPQEMTREEKHNWLIQKAHLSTLLNEVCRRTEEKGFSIPGASGKAINYILNDEVGAKLAQGLRGDADTPRKAIESIRTLMFEEDSFVESAGVPTTTAEEDVEIKKQFRKNIDSMLRIGIESEAGHEKGLRNAVMQSVTYPFKKAASAYVSNYVVNMISVLDDPDFLERITVGALDGLGRSLRVDATPSEPEGQSGHIN